MKLLHVVRTAETTKKIPCSGRSFSRLFLCKKLGSLINLWTIGEVAHHRANCDSWGTSIPSNYKSSKTIIIGSWCKSIATQLIRLGYQSLTISGIEITCNLSWIILRSWSGNIRCVRRIYRSIQLILDLINTYLTLSIICVGGWNDLNRKTHNSVFTNICSHTIQRSIVSLWVSKNTCSWIKNSRITPGKGVRILDSNRSSKTRHIRTYYHKAWSCSICN